MTLDEALELARAAAGPLRQSCPLCESSIKFRGDSLCVDCATDVVRKLGAFVLDTLGQQMPCGFDEPRAYGATVLCDGYGQIEPDEAIAIGAALIRAGLAAKGER